MPESEGGRVDIFLLSLGEKFCKDHLETKVNGFPLWSAGLGELAAQTVKAAGITRKPVKVPGPVVDWFMGKVGGA